MVLPWPNTDMSDQDERIEELESKVGRLEATIQGLTEELVEVHDRLETLEAAADAQSAAESAQSPETRRSEQSADDASAQTDKNDEAKSGESHEEDETGGDSGLGDDIIVA